MRTKKALVGAAGLLLAAGFLRGQLLMSELGEEAQWEAFLRTAAITAAEQFTGSEAVANPYKLTLEKDGLKHFALWKNIDTDEFGAPDRWRYEIAAYRFDRLLELGGVPPTVERRFNGEKGSLQLWIDDTVTLKKKTEAGDVLPAERRPEWNRAAYLERAFDSLIADSDRNANNILVTSDWRAILIDHSRAFRTDGPYAEGLIFGARGLMRAADGSALPLLPLPRAFFERLKTLDFRTIKDAVKPYLTDREIRAALARAGLIAAEIAEAVRDGGEDKVLY